MIDISKAAYSGYVVTSASRILSFFIPSWMVCAILYPCWSGTLWCMSSAYTCVSIVIITKAYRVTVAFGLGILCAAIGAS